MHHPDDFLDYYRRELAYLREQGRDFAQRHPRVAKRLGLGGNESPDPHTERLIESFAFLTARVQRDIDREFPQVATALLEQVCPSLARAWPSMTVAEMQLDATQGKVTSGLAIPKGSMLQALGHDGNPCRFRVAWDTTLWPLRISQVTVEDGRVVTLGFTAADGTSVNELELNSLRLHLAGDLMTTMPVHEMLLTNLQQVEVVCSSGSVSAIGSQALIECGYEEEQAVLPCPSHAHPAYVLLQEYFAFARKFQFFDVRGLRGRVGSGQRFSLRLTFDRSTGVLSRLSTENFKLGCVPIVNLFAMTSEPVHVDRRQHEYLLVADRQRESATEIYSVESVISSDPAAQRPSVVPPFMATRDDTASADELFWVSRVQPTLRGDLNGTDTILSFVDRAQVRAVPREPVVYAQVLCTNRRVAEQVPAGARLLGVGLSSSLSIKALYAPSPQRDPMLNSQALWALVSVLRLNHRSLVDGDEGLRALRSLLLLFAGDGAAQQAQVRALRTLHAKPGVARVGMDGWRGFCRGTDVDVEFEVESFAGDSALLLSSVLARFLALYTTTNHFVRLRLVRGGETWKQWPPLAGSQAML